MDLKWINKHTNYLKYSEYCNSNIDQFIMENRLKVYFHSHLSLIVNFSCPIQEKEILKIKKEFYSFEVDIAQLQTSINNLGENTFTVQEQNFFPLVYDDALSIINSNSIRQSAIISLKPGYLNRMGNSRSDFVSNYDSAESNGNSWLRITLHGDLEKSSIYLKKDDLLAIEHSLNKTQPKSSDKYSQIQKIALSVLSNISRLEDPDIKFGFLKNNGDLNKSRLSKYIYENGKSLFGSENFENGGYSLATIRAALTF